MRLIYLSPVPWISFSQRSHQFVDWFHRKTGAKVLWIDPYPTRLPQLSDLRRSIAKKEHEQSRNPSWLRVIKPSSLPIEPLPGSKFINGLMWNKTFFDIKNFVDKNNSILVIGKPSIFALEVQKFLRDSPSIYDAMDDFPAFYSGLSSLMMQKCEEKIVRRVDILWVSSSKLKQRWSELRPDVQLVHNGLDASKLPKRKYYSANENNVFGYVGTIGDWFDWDWVITLAKIRSDDKIRLIGPVFTSPPNNIPYNIEILPSCDNASALNAMCYFDVGLIPFKRNYLTESVDPIKYYEYRALGLPVISTDFGEMKFRKNLTGTFICKEKEEIFSLANFALLHTEDPAASRDFALSNSWQVRFDAARIAL